MKTLSNRELQQIAFNDSSDIGYNDFMNLYKICTMKKNFFYGMIPLLHQVILYLLKTIL